MWLRVSKELEYYTISCIKNTLAYTKRGKNSMKKHIVIKKPNQKTKLEYFSPEDRIYDPLFLLFFYMFLMIWV